MHTSSFFFPKAQETEVSSTILGPTFIVAPYWYVSLFIHQSDKAKLGARYMLRVGTVEEQDKTPFLLSGILI